MPVMNKVDAKYSSIPTLLKKKQLLRDPPLAVPRDCIATGNMYQQSKTEFSVAKQAYVLTRSGWFS